MTLFFNPEQHEVDQQARDDLVYRTEKKVHWKPAVAAVKIPVDKTLIAPAHEHVQTTLVQLAFERPSHDVIAGLVPTQIRAAGFNVYHFFTDFRFMPRYPDYVSQSYESLHLKYFTSELGRSTPTRTPHPLKGIQRYVDSKTNPLYANMIQQIGLQDLFARDGDVYELHIDRPKLDGDQDDDDQDSPDEDDPSEPPLTRITVDGDDAGQRINALALLLATNQ
jgi:hypothetical protein